MHVILRHLCRCTAGLLLAVGVSATELPAPLASALSRLRAAEAYAWTLDVQNPGAPFTLAPIKGSAKAGGDGLMEATVEGKPVQVAVSGGRRVVKLDSEWETSSKTAPQNEFQGMEIARLFRVPLPVDELNTLLNGVTAIRSEKDGGFTATLSADVAGDIVRSPMKDMPARDFTPEIKDAAASIKFSVKDGVLQRYAISSTANISLPFGNTEIKQTAVVELREITKADVTLPPAALKKLQAPTKP